MSLSLLFAADLWADDVVTGNGQIVTFSPLPYLVNASPDDYQTGIPGSTPFEMELVVENTATVGFNQWGSTILATTSNPHDNYYWNHFQIFHHAATHDKTPNTLNFKASVQGDREAAKNVTAKNFKLLIRYDGFYTYTIRTTILDASLAETNDVSTASFDAGGNRVQSTITMMSSALPVGINIKSLKIRLYPITLNQNTLGTDPDGKYYGSICYPVAFELPDGVAAYKLTSAAEGEFLLSLVAQGGEVLPKNTPAILVSNSAVEDEFMITANEGSPVMGNLFSGSLTAVARNAQKTTYILSGKQGIGFYQYTGTTIPAFKAYYESASPLAPARFAFRFEDEEQVATGLEETSDCELSASASIYDLMGCPVAADRLLKGHFYIVNGQKILY